MAHTKRPDPSAQWLRNMRRLYNRPVPPTPWTDSGNLPWHELDFSIRMLREHLDETNGAASRTTAERTFQIEWLWNALQLQPGHQLFDITCGPGLYAIPFAERGCHVTGVDISPASIAYAIELAESAGVASRCHFIEADIHSHPIPPAQFDAAFLLYGQLGVMPPEKAALQLKHIAASLKPGGKLCLEMLNPAHIDKQPSRWWYTDDSGVWGNTPYLHLGERHWDEANQTSIERYQIVDIESGTMEVIHLCDQSYSIAEMVDGLKAAGFQTVEVFEDSAGLALYDQQEWILYVATR